MTRKINYYVVLFFVIFFTMPSYAQEKEKPVIDFYGFINYEAFYDSRLMRTAREQDIILFPERIIKDAMGKDINGESSLSMATFHSRIGTNISGPQVLNAKLEGNIEVDFLGTNDFTVNLIRLRHLWFKLKWSKTQLLLGQYWHPMFVTESGTKSVTWGGGIPVHTLSRNPQVRFSYIPGDNLKVHLSLLSQRDFTNSGPEGGSSIYIRNSKTPEVMLQVVAGQGKPVYAGATIGYKTITPRITSQVGNETFAVEEMVGSMASNAFLALEFDRISIHSQVIYGENLNNLLQLGGYASTSISNPLTGELNYAPYKVLATWIDLNVNITETFSAGFFTGVSNNLGLTETVDTNPTFSPDVYGLGTDIRQLFNFSPRIIYKDGPLRFALESIYLNAAYGNDTDNHLRPEQTENVDGIRILFSASRFF